MKELELIVKELIKSLETAKEQYQNEIEMMSKNESVNEEIIECNNKINIHLSEIEKLEKMKYSKNKKLQLCTKIEQICLQSFLVVPIILSAVSFYLLFVNFPVAIKLYGITAVITATLLTLSIKIFQKEKELEANVKNLSSEIDEQNNCIDYLNELINQINLSLSSDIEAKHKETRLEISNCEELIWNMIDDELLDDSEYIEELRKSFYPTIYMPNSLSGKTLSLKHN